MSLCKSLFIGEIFMFSWFENVGFSVGKRRKYKGILQNGQKCSMFHVRKHVPFISESY